MPYKIKKRSVKRRRTAKRTSAAPGFKWKQVRIKKKRRRSRPKTWLESIFGF